MLMREMEEFEDDKLKKRNKENKNKYTNMGVKYQNIVMDVSRVCTTKHNFHVENPGYVSDSLWGKKKNLRYF